MFASLIFGAPKAKAEAVSKVAAASKAVPKSAPKVVRAGLTPRQERLALEKRDRDYANDLLAQVPKKPVNSGYKLFLQEVDLKGDVSTLGKQASQKWGTLSDAQKKTYSDRQIKLQDRYFKALAAFKETLTPKKRNVLIERGIELPHARLPSSERGKRPLTEYIRFVQAFLQEHKLEPGVKSSRERQQELIRDAAAAYRAQK